jgi:hypothetical protein
LKGLGPRFFAGGSVPVSCQIAIVLLDQTVVQDNNMYGNGTVGHGTVSNSYADALVKVDPNRFEYVDAPNYLLGVDY